MTDETNESNLNDKDDSESISGQKEETGIDIDLAITIYYGLLQSLSPEDKLKMITVTRLIGHIVVVTEELGLSRPPRP